jgi:hypothetical protein
LALIAGEPFGLRHPHHRDLRLRQVAVAALDGREVQRAQLRVDVGARAAAEDQRRAAPGVAEGGGRVAGPAEVAVAVERRVAVVRLVHLRQEADVDGVLLLGEAAVEAQQVAVALAAGDPARRDALGRAVAVLRRDVQHQAGAGRVGGPERVVVAAVPLDEHAHHRDVLSDLAAVGLGRHAAADAGVDLARRRLEGVGARGRGGGDVARSTSVRRSIGRVSTMW